jgi:hypothetical protein
MHTTARHPAARRARLRLPAAVTLGATLAASFLLPPLAGCKSEVKQENAQIKIRYPELPKKEDVPPYMKGTIWEVTTRTNDEPWPVASYGLVGRLRGTGDSTASLPVRQWMVKQMARHGYGSKLLEDYKNISAEQVLRDPSYAVVQVEGLIPPGAREGDFFDVRVRAMKGNRTSNLSGGIVFETDLATTRSGMPDLGAVTYRAKAKGPILVNPAYALEGAGGPGDGGTGAAAPGGGSAQAKASLRTGVVMDGGRVLADRPIVLRLLHPSRATARYMEQRINQRFQDVADYPRKDVMPAMFQVASAKDEGIVEVYVPRAYGGDWRHFTDVVEHLYLSASAAEQIARAKALAEQAPAEAARADGYLMSIGYALEGIGAPALQYVLPMMAHANPDVAFVMARTAVFINDGSGAAQETLLRMACNDAHPFQVEAVRTLGALPSSPDRNQRIREVLDSRNTLARIEAYKVLVRNKDPNIVTHWIHDPRDRRPEGERGEKFAVDVVEAAGPPIVFASRTGIARIAVIGPRPGPALALPVLYTAMDRRLMIASPPSGNLVTIFYRDDNRAEPIRMPSRPDLAEVIARLGGVGAPEEERFDFTYGEVVAILQSMSQQRLIRADLPDGQVAVAPFIFEQPRDSQDLIESAPLIEPTRPNTDGAAWADEAPPGTGASVVQK